MDYFETIALLEQQLHLHDKEWDREQMSKAEIHEARGEHKEAQEIRDIVANRKKERSAWNKKGAMDIASDVKDMAIENKGKIINKVVNKIPVVGTINKNVSRYNRLKELLGKFR